METELITVAQGIERARCPQDVFGVLNGRPEEQLRAARSIFHSLSKVTHPDRYALPDSQQTAQRTMTRLNALWAEARSQITAGRYADPGVASGIIQISTRRRTYEVGPLIDADEVCLHYACQPEVADAVQSGTFKIARTATDNDLVRIEASVLRHLRADKSLERLFPFVPAICESFLYDDSRTAPRQVNIISRLSNVYSLEELRTAYPQGIAAQDVAWLWRKLLIALGFAHARGVIHGAVLPPHILIEPAQHGLILDNWVYALHEPVEQPGAHLAAIVAAYATWYPPEVSARQPPMPGLDIFMGARCMVHLLGGDPITSEMPTVVPKAIASFFRGCLLPAPNHRPQQAWDLLNEFTELIERLWGPRTFRPFAMPSR